MIIFSNDYAVNLPASRQPAKGGPANFARRFKNFLADGGNHWIGLIVNFTAIKSPRIKSISRKGKNCYYRLDLPGRLLKKVSRAEKGLEVEKIFKPASKILAKLISKTEADIVFLNGFSLANWLILKSAAEANIPVAIQHAGVWTKELRMYKDFFNARGRKIMEKMEWEISTIAAAEIFLNDWSRRYYNTNVSATAKDKTHIIPLPVDFKNYHCLSQKRKKRKNFNIGTIARWDRIKNHEALAKLADEANKRGLSWQFHSVTTIPQTRKKIRLKNLYRKNIKLAPPLDQKGIEKFCHDMDLLILPSHFDVSPHIVLEAIGCGTPVAISNNVGFVDDFKKFGAKDWVINFDATSLAIKQITKIAGKPMPRNLTQKIKANHQSAKVFKSYTKLFKNIIKKQ